MIKKIISAIELHFLLILTFVFAILGIVYRTPLEQTMIIQEYIGIVPQTSYDMPSIFVYFFVLIFFVVFIDSFFIYQKAFKSDYLFANGLDNNCSCIGADIERQTVGEWCWIRTEGIKEFPLRGSHIVSNLVTHTHKVGNHVIMEGHVIPRTPLTFIPEQIKSDVRQRREGMFGASECSVGYLSSAELSQNKQFKADNFEDLIETNEKGKTFETSSFVDSIRDKNRDLNMIIEFNNGENESLTNYLSNVGQVGKAILKDGNRGVLDRLVGR